MTKANDKRIFSQEGFLLADAVLAKVGPLPYTRGELGMEGDPGSVIMIDRSKDALEQALPSMIGAPITINHPKEFVRSGDADSKVVGSVASIPQIDGQGYVKAKVRVFNQDAIDMIRSGDDELSPGFNFVMKDLDTSRNTASISEMSVNHVAIVPKGRAGNAVRIMDALPPNLYNNVAKESSTMDDKQLNEIIAKAVDAAMSTKGDASKDAQDTKSVFVSAITDALKPVLAAVDEMKSKQDASDKKVADAQAQEAADKERAEFAQTIIDAERLRYELLDTAKRFVAADKHEELKAKDTKDILVMAVGDAVTDAADKSEDYLKGILDGMVKASDNKPAHQATDTTPEGVVTVGNKVEDRANMYAKRHKNRHKEAK